MSLTYLDKGFHYMLEFPCQWTHQKYSRYHQIQELGYRKLEFYLEFLLHSLQGTQAMSSIHPNLH